jgi:hypothetical protein
MQLAVKRYSDQLMVATREGDLPLHMIAKKKPVIDEDDMNDTNELFLMILRQNIQAASILNGDGLSPLALAIHSGHRWDSGIIRSSLTVTPASIGTVDLPPQILPYLLGRLIQEKCMNEVFGILRAVPPG